MVICFNFINLPHINQTKKTMDTYTPVNSINSVNYEKQQKARSFDLALSKALQDVKRLTENNLQFKLEIIELKKQLEKNNN